jgi:hypothetical protein
MDSGLAELELELRLLPGVVNVGFGIPEPSGHVAVTIVALEHEPELERTATRMARAFRSAATVEIVDRTPRAEPPQQATVIVGPDERVALLESTIDRDGQAEVQLSWKGGSATGIGTGGALIGPAQATLGALEGLGIEVEARLASVSTGRGVPNSPVRVILRVEPGGPEFVGIAQGASEPESSARATLAAFNRYAGTRKMQLS